MSQRPRPAYAFHVENAAALPQIDGPDPYRNVPPMRPEGVGEDDGFDRKRIDYARTLWTSQDILLRSRDRQVEENIRMLCGQQWSIWSELIGKFVDISQFFTDDERRWRQLPVLNRLLYWFMLLHARLTENPPVITFQPASGDRLDAETAEIMDVVWKYLWSETGMLEVVDHVSALLIPGGRAHWMSRVDPTIGDLRTYVGPAVLSLLHPDGSAATDMEGQPIQRPVDQVPYGPDGEPAASWTMEGGLQMGEAHEAPEGGIVVEPLSCLEVRGEWGPTPWHRKGWHLRRAYLTPQQVYDAYGVWADPEVVGNDAEDVGALQRMLFGAGFFGAAGGRFEGATMPQDEEQGYVEVHELWMRPCDRPDMDRGRQLIVSRERVFYDGPRYAEFRYTSPIRTVDFVKVPGRPQGTSPQEMLNGPQRTYNRIYSQILQHTNLVSNPIKVIDQDSGLQEDQVVSKPGLTVTANLKKGIDPVHFVSPPPLGSDVYKALELLRKELDDLGNVAGAEGRSPHDDASGELVKELRFNSDRFIGPTARRFVVEMGRMAEDWQAILAVLWDEQKILTVAGDDGVARTVAVLPQMFTEGAVHVTPEIESMLPEGRGERQARVFRLYEMGAFGQPGSAPAVGQLLDLANFPHLDRATRPGGIDFVTAEQENGKLVLGSRAEEIPVMEWYDHAVHLAAHERYMKSPDYLKLPPSSQQQFVIHRQTHQMAAAKLAARQLADQVHVQHQLARAAPRPPGAGEDEAGAARGTEQGPPDRGPTSAGAARVPEQGPTSGYPV